MEDQRKPEDTQTFAILPNQQADDEQGSKG